jgi:hypothetical protein
MQRHLHIVATGHHYQLGAGFSFGGFKCTIKDQIAFLNMLRELIATESLNALAEETNRQALQEAGATQSVLEILASELSLPHTFCEPDRSERAGLGIYEENSIRLSAYPKVLDETEIQRLVADSWRRREEEWLSRLEKIDAARILFVCGADHVHTFVPRAEKHGFQISVAYANWEA